MTRLEETVRGLREIRDSLRAELAVIERMLVAAEPRTNSKPIASRKAKAKSNGPSKAVKAKVLAVVHGLQEPTPTREIAKRMNGTGQSTVSKALAALADEGEIRHMGFQQGVKGRRPLYAPKEVADDAASTFTRDLEPVRS